MHDIKACNIYWISIYTLWNVSFYSLLHKYNRIVHASLPTVLFQLQFRLRFVRLNDLIKSEIIIGDTNKTSKTHTISHTYTRARSHSFIWGVLSDNKFNTKKSRDSDTRDSLPTPRYLVQTLCIISIIVISVWRILYLNVIFLVSSVCYSTKTRKQLFYLKMYDEWETAIAILLCVTVMRWNKI